MENRSNLPRVVIHALSSHGPVEVNSIGNGSTTRVPCAPFEDTLYLFAVPGSALESGLLMAAGLRVSAKGEDGEYTLRMTGRAHAGVPLNAHRERSALEAWAPEGVPQSRILVVPFVAEELEFFKGTGDEAERFSGKTPVGISRVGAVREYGRAALSGLALPMAVCSVLVTVVWLIVQGVRFDGRELATMLALVAGVGLITGLRLIYVSIAFVLWRQNKARIQDASVLAEGLVAPGEARKVAAVLLGFSAFAMMSLGLTWGSSIVGVVVWASGVWLIVPAWALHLLMRQPEASK